MFAVAIPQVGTEWVCGGWSIQLADAFGYDASHVLALRAPGGRTGYLFSHLDGQLTVVPDGVNVPASVFAFASARHAALRLFSMAYSGYSKAISAGGQLDEDAVSFWGNELASGEESRYTLLDGRTFRVWDYPGPHGGVWVSAACSSPTPQSRPRVCATLQACENDDGTWSAGYVKVDEPFRGLGIASALYNHIERVGHVLVPCRHGIGLTEDGMAFWERRDPELLSRHLQAEEPISL